MGDSPTGEAEEPTYVVDLAWRSSAPCDDTDLDRLVDSLAEADPEVCLQYHHGSDAHSVSLGSMAASPIEAAIECANRLVGAASALGINAEVAEVIVYSDDAESRFTLRGPHPASAG